MVVSQFGIIIVIIRVPHFFDTEKQSISPIKTKVWHTLDINFIYAIFDIVQAISGRHSRAGGNPGMRMIGTRMEKLCYHYLNLVLRMLESKCCNLRRGSKNLYLFRGSIL